MISLRRCDNFYRSDATSAIRVAAENAETRIGESLRRKSLRLKISSDEIVAAEFSSEH